MLIRSQDKKILIPNELGYLAVEKYGSGYSVFLNSGYLQETWWRLGEYSTEEKAIKVLDMIEKNYYNLEAFKAKYPYESCTSTFQMPQESEV